MLLSFGSDDVAPIVDDVVNDRRSAKSVTLAEAILSDGQRLTGVSDLFIGPKTHRSARYEIEYGAQKEVQSSIGTIVSTGLRSCAWMRAIVTGAMAIAESYGRAVGETDKPWSWNADFLQFAVREPFPSRTGSANLVLGRAADNAKLFARSLMPEGGVIFSDGMESDYLSSGSGTVARIGVAKVKEILVARLKCVFSLPCHRSSV